MENNNDISTFIVGMLLEMKEVIISKTTKKLDFNRMKKHFNNFKNTFTPLEKET